MSTRKSDSLTESHNIFLDNQKFSELQSALISFKIISGSYETYSTKIKPESEN